jgi:hypothetical protein
MNGQSNGEQLNIDIEGPAMVPGGNPRDALAADAPAEATTVADGYTGWRAELGAAYIASEDPALTRFVVHVADTNPSEEGQNFLHAALRAPGTPTVGGGTPTSVDSTSPEAATSQLRSNLKVLAGALPVGTIENAQTRVIFVDQANNAFGVEADIHVAALSDLQRHVGDITQGLKTGLVGDDNATVEGLAINIVDDSGLRAGVWINARDGSGMGATSPTLDLDAGLRADTKFPNLTGGPDTLSSIHGAPAIG